MKSKSSLIKILLTLILLGNIFVSKSQVAIDTAVDFTVKDINSLTHDLFNYLDDNKLVVLDFFTTTCGPCQTYASEINLAYEFFGCNSGNVVFLGINWGSDNNEVREFDSIWGAHYPSVSGLQGGGNGVVEDYQTMSYPTVIIITPDHIIANNYIWPPAYDSIVQEVLEAGGIPGMCTVDVDKNDFDRNSVQSLSTGELIIHSSGYEILDMQLINLSGQIIYNRRIQTGSPINPGIGKGLYLIRLLSNGKILHSDKIFLPL